MCKNVARWAHQRIKLISGRSFFLDKSDLQWACASCKCTACGFVFIIIRLIVSGCNERELLSKRENVRFRSFLLKQFRVDNIVVNPFTEFQRKSSNREPYERVGSWSYLLLSAMP